MKSALKKVDASYQVIIDMQVAASCAKDAAVESYWLIRDRMESGTEVSFDKRYLTADHAREVRVTALCDGQESVLLTQSAAENSSTANSSVLSFKTRIVVNVTASSSAEAVEFALDDIGDDQLGVWDFDVTSTAVNGTPQLVSVIQGQDY